MRRGTLIVGGTAAVAAAAAGVRLEPVDAPAGPAQRYRVRRPIVIGHRGASGYRPEHTLESYRLAIELGADYIEPDLVSTKDGVLVARHENNIARTTDVADHPEFAGRRTTKVVDGLEVTGWFTEDFTLAELRTLRARERIPAVRPGNTVYDGRFTVPTLQEIIDLARRETRRHGRQIGIYPETKNPSYFQAIGLPLEEPLVAALHRNGLAHRGARVYLQSFETANLRKLRRMVDVPLVQLLDDAGRPYDFETSADPRSYADLATPAGLAWIRQYADAVGPAKDLIVPRDAGGRLLAPSTLVADAHRAGLLVHAWTFRTENSFLPADFRAGADPAAWGDPAAEYRLFLGLGLDGVFADHPDTAVSARRSMNAPVAVA
jgi:glycerophosphoryl diester phosphodiesterase